MPLKPISECLWCTEVVQAVVEAVNMNAAMLFIIIFVSLAVERPSVLPNELVNWRP